jgi:hypothetical protein
MEDVMRTSDIVTNGKPYLRLQVGLYAANLVGLTYFIQEGVIYREDGTPATEQDTGLDYPDQTVWALLQAEIAKCSPAALAAVGYEA